MRLGYPARELNPRRFMKLSLRPVLGLGLGLLAAATLATLGGCASPEGEEVDDAVLTSADELTVTSSFVSRGTGYYPSSSALEGGFVDRRGAKLRTLQQFLAGTADYVSVAMDSNAFSYGQHLRIKELETKYGRAINFRVVDTGGAFKNKGRSRIDICVANKSASVDATINGVLHIDAVTTASSGSPPAPAPTTPATPGTGASCNGDGQCNPGNDGSGKICTAGKCVAGCRSNAQCPGSTRCVSGQCN